MFAKSLSENCVSFGSNTNKDDKVSIENKNQQQQNFYIIKNFLLFICSSCTSLIHFSWNAINFSFSHSSPSQMQLIMLLLYIWRNYSWLRENGVEVKFFFWERKAFGILVQENIKVNNNNFIYGNFLLRLLLCFNEYYFMPYSITEIEIDFLLLNKNCSLLHWHNCIQFYCHLNRKHSTFIQNFYHGYFPKTNLNIIQPIFFH